MINILATIDLMFESLTTFVEFEMIISSFVQYYLLYAESSLDYCYKCLSGRWLFIRISPFNLLSSLSIHSIYSVTHYKKMYPL